MEDGFLKVVRLSGVGYRPIIKSDNWQVAVINWEGPRTEITSLEKHKLTDEAFLLIEGSVYLIIFRNRGLNFDVFRMRTNSVYSVLKNTWHAVILEGRCKVIIVEKTDTHLNDDIRRKLTLDERTKITKSLESICKDASSKLEASYS